ncbi:phenylalanine 4-monooxygenase [Photobacterium swingsii]|uniref:Phenylalanine-4-hydroxylase n=1 Tax=Photobacterium swingsii TaxID=680026 RepID=A0A0J8VEM5_9GAMM|nr:phenylalanine 4-monooxygenase [Photobacterium swingsii]KMV31736.1 phenylalanine 4-monooxygenase [Photobacterium swingsii]PSW25345.1 phenylalanine 4-monooxygenase [Photobacterium swingsii]
MGSLTQYVSKQPDAKGVIHWSDDENRIWHDLITRQLRCIQGRACDEYCAGLALLDLPQACVPQLHDINQVLLATTGWQCVEVPALINFDRFFTMLANKQFPVATFLRRREEFDYLQEPDFFHEIFGHCAMLTNPAFAAFTHTYGQLGAAASSQDRVYLARLYWFTVEFGLLQAPQGLRIYGGGILSSPAETKYAMASDATTEKAQISAFDPIEVMRTPYRIDIMQPIYFKLSSISQLYDLAQQDIMAMVHQAKQLGLHSPLYPPKLPSEKQDPHLKSA